jgi:anti-sigma B factor antagonist
LCSNLRSPEFGCIQYNSLAKEGTVASGSNIKISDRQVGDITILDLAGDITLFNSPEIRKALILLLRERRVPQLFVNMTAIKYVDSSGIASLVEGLKISREQGARFVLYGLSKPARTVLELTHLMRVFEVHDTEEQALAAVASAAQKSAPSSGDGAS